MVVSFLREVSLRIWSVLAKKKKHSHVNVVRKATVSDFKKHFIKTWKTQ